MSEGLIGWWGDFLGLKEENSHRKFKTILFGAKEGIAIITLNNLGKLNLLDINAEVEIEEACKKAEKKRRNKGRYFHRGRKESAFYWSRYKALIEIDLHLSSICMGTQDFKEGVRAFVEKRKPNFQGR